MRIHSLEVLVEPGTGLQERALHGEPLLLDALVAAHREPVRHPTVQVDLVRLLDGLEDLLGLVPFLGREDLVGFCLLHGKYG